MRLLHTADFHTGKKLYGINRNEDLVYALEQIKDICKEEKIQILLIAGDIFDKRNPDFESQEIILDFLLEVNSFGIYTLLISGNHDSYDFMKIYKKFKKITNIYVFDKPTSNKKEAIFEYRDLKIACLPYPDERAITSISENKAKDYVERVTNYIKDLSIEMKEAKYKILMAHIMLNEDKIESTQSKYDIILPEYTLKLDSIPKNFDYIALGHIHKYQKVEDPILKVYYSGSPYQVDFSEKDQKEKFVNIISLNNRTTEVKSIKLALKRELVELDLKEEDSIEKIDEILKPYSSANVLVKVRLKVKIKDHFFNRKKELIQKILGDKLAVFELYHQDSLNHMYQDNLNLIDLYTEFYKKEHKTNPPENLKKLFQTIFNEVIYETYKA